MIVLATLIKTSKQTDKEQKTWRAKLAFISCSFSCNNSQELSSDTIEREAYECLLFSLIIAQQNQSPTFLASPRSMSCALSGGQPAAGVLPSPCPYEDGVPGSGTQWNESESPLDGHQNPSHVSLP